MVRVVLAARYHLHGCCIDSLLCCSLRGGAEAQISTGASQAVRFSRCSIDSLRDWPSHGRYQVRELLGCLATQIDFGPFSIGSDAPEGWSTFYVPLSIVLGLTLIAIFVWWECRHPYPLMPMRVWRDKNFSLVRRHRFSVCLLNI